MLAEKLFHRAVKLEAVFFIREAVSFVGLYDVRHFDAAGLKRLYHLIRFRFVYARIVRALRNQQRNLDVLTVENRRRRRQQVFVFLRMPNHLVEHFQIRFPIRRDGLDECKEV